MNNVPPTNPAFVQGYAVPGANFPPPPPPPATAPPMSAPAFVSFGAALPDEGRVREFLSIHRWPLGLQDTLLKNLMRVPLRFFICDDSGSMSTSDGHKLVKNTAGKEQLVNCSRWSELVRTLTFHAELAYNAHAPTEFRLLNGGAPIMIGDGSPGDMDRLLAFKALLDSEPNGGTPLCRHINEIVARIRPMAVDLRNANQKVCIVIATDGESSDGDIATALKPLKDLPVWVVIRLCTDDSKIVSYWNDIDTVLELDMDVLDDLCGEAEEISEKNPWLVYGEPIHKIREFGIPVKELDLLDESALTMEQIRKFCSLLLGGPLESYPSPEADWAEFARVMKGRLDVTSEVWDPIKKTPQKWIHLNKINPKGCTIC